MNMFLNVIFDALTLIKIRVIYKKGTNHTDFTVLNQIEPYNP